jgi:negative regulator of sigma E activity
MAHENRITDDEALSALLDGALPAAEADELRARLLRDPVLARRLAALQNVDGVLSRAYGGIVNEPLPDGVVALLDASERAEHAQDSDGRLDAGQFPVWTRSNWLDGRTAIAASVALVGGFLLAFALQSLTRSSTELEALAEGGTIEQGSLLYEALQTLPSSQSRELTTEVSATPRLTFVNVDGEYCRRLDLTSDSGRTQTLACRRNGDWQLELATFAAQSSASPGGVYRPATDDVSPQIENAIDTFIEGEPLGLEAESALIRRGWSAR